MSHQGEISVLQQRAGSTSSSRLPSLQSPEDIPEQSQTSAPVFLSSLCPCRCVHLPRRSLHRKGQMLQQSRRRSLAGPRTPRRTSVSSAGGGDSGPSCTGRQCLWSSPVCCLFLPKLTLLTLTQLQFQGENYYHLKFFCKTVPVIIQQSYT